MIDYDIDSFVIYSDLVDIPIGDREATETALKDAQASDQARGIYTKGGRAFDARGKDLGPVGRLVI